MEIDIAHHVKAIFDPFYKADISNWQAFASRLHERSFKKNEVIKESNTVEKYLNILIQGSVGLFIWNGKHEICLNLLYENDFFADYLSFLKQEKTVLSTIALEDSKVWSISYTDLNALYKSSISSVHIGRIAAETLYAKKQQEQINLLTLTPEERYLQLVSKHPRIIQRTSLKYIASYLGLTPESLSRLRKRVITA
jgi:CRP-like cAMP-binding protein